MKAADSGRAAELIREYRRAAGLSQRQLADSAQVSIGVVRDLEQRRTTRPHAESVRRLAEALGLDTEQGGRFTRAARGEPGDQVGAGFHGAGFPGGLRLAVLGPLAAWRDGAQVSLGTPMQRAVLGLLALTPNVLVHRAAIIDALWGDDLPATAVHLVQVYVSRLRRLLDPRLELACVGVSYELRVAAGELDLTVFDAYASQAVAAHADGELQVACATYSRALRLWRAEPLADLELLRTHPAVAGLRQRRADLVVRYADAACAGGSPEVVLPWLRELTVAEPLNERAHAWLMVALAGSGQQAAALGVFDEVRRRLNEQLGVRPGAELAGAHRRVLRQDLTSAAVLAQPPPPGQVSQPVPRQLPAQVSDFAGRAAELAALDGMLEQEVSGQARISVITGVGGVGKTALAVHWAHRVAARFPDGQLYVNLRGFDPTGTPLRPAEAIRGFLAALAVPASRIPAGTEARAALFRSLLAGRRMLVVLDNARDPAQVRPLLPGSSGCPVVVTSRDWLAGLVAAEGASQLSLDVLTSAEAAELLTRRLGRRRTATDPGDAAALAELSALCAGLPIALVVVAARAITRPRLPLAALAAELRMSRNRLDALSTGDDATDVRSVFSWSYLSLAGPAARMFRLAGLHTGPEISAPAAASLAGVPLAAAGQALRDLTSACLIDEHRPGRFSLHDLIREYAAERARATGTRASRQAALRRVLDHYLHTAEAARTLLERRQAWYTLPERSRGMKPERFAGQPEAVSWVETERPVLIAAIALAARAGFDEHAVRLPMTLPSFLDQFSRWQDLLDTHAVALAAAERLGDLEAQAYAHRGMGGACATLGRHADAYAHGRRSLALFERRGAESCSPGLPALRAGGLAAGVRHRTQQRGLA